MSGWLALAVLLGVTALLLFALGTRGALLKLAAAALMAGSAGYALQGRPGLSSSLHNAESEAAALPLTRLRHAFFGSFTPSGRWFIVADAYAQRGQTDQAVSIMRAAVREHPKDVELWVGLGNALVDHAGVLTAASQLAYARAMTLAPEHPAAPFFLGLALARSGDREGAARVWRELLAKSPADAGWRPLVEDVLAALESSQPR